MRLTIRSLLALMAFIVYQPASGVVSPRFRAERHPR